MNEIEHLYKEHYTKLQDIKNALERKCIPTLIEKMKFAEVSTPFKLIDQMLNKIPNDFWNNYNHKIFEPCCGKGNIVISIFERFFKGLEYSIPNKIERSNFIANNCIYFSDISKENIDITREILKHHIEWHCGVYTNSNFN